MYGEVSDYRTRHIYLILLVQGSQIEVLVVSGLFPIFEYVFYS